MANIRICTKCDGILLDQYDFTIKWHAERSRHYYSSICKECYNEHQSLRRQYKVDEEYYKKHLKLKRRSDDEKHSEEQFHKLIGLCLSPNNKFKGWIREAILEKTSYLYDKYNLTGNDLFEELAFNFFYYNHVDKYYNSWKSGPSTFILYYVNNHLKYIIRKCNQGTFGLGRLDNRDAMRKASSLSELEINNEGIEYQPMEKQTFDLVVNDDPEHWLMAKQIFVFAEKFFGLEDFKVLTGDLSENNRADKLGISLLNYKQRLQYKTSKFKKIVKEDYLF